MGCLYGMRDGHLHVKYVSVGETLPPNRCQILGQRNGKHLKTTCAWNPSSVYE